MLTKLSSTDNDTYWDVNKGQKALDNTADAYDDTETYNTGDMVIYDNVLYVCNTNSTTGTWDATHWDQTTVAAVTNSLNSALSPKSFSKTMYGISYQLVQIGKLVIVSAWSGTTSTALNAQDVLITLGAFDSSLSGKTFIIDIPTTNTTNTSMRMGMDINTGNIKTYTSIGSGTALRFFLVGVIN